ncbi:histidine triad nucleotide-binding protein [Salsipaludibacter albus]|uniref:histidine triad nucleotide-binding protein n=1 Tax=Salsipaludibacter albus TaxID=2849650 RepID=UPI001EE4AA9B|nr:histidine triad nucleotide-binding protein [Salsipaludibacter albus]MBY5161901.1 histidine triad nucleotide-binding protein [Salsipaludibacter albus]
MADCLFCSIIAGDLPSDRVGENEVAVAFRDINPRAPVHVLVVPRRHLTSAHELSDDDGDELAAVFSLARQVAEAEGTADGYRVTTNIGRGGGQMVDHLHLHVLGGRQLGHIDSLTGDDG